MTGGIEEDDLSLSTVWCLQFEQCRLMQISENALARAADDPMDSLNPVAALYSAETLQAVRDRAADRDRMNSELSIDNPPDLDSLKSWKGIEFALMLLDYDLTATDPIFLMGTVLTSLASRSQLLMLFTRDFVLPVVFFLMNA